MRIIKILLILSIALLGLIAFITNLFTLQLNFSTVATILAMDGTFGWSGTAWRSLSNPLITGAVYSTIVLTEFSVALLCSTGAIRMWQARNRTATEFHNAKRLALIGCGIGFLLWFGGFIIIAGEWFLMWQHRAETLAHAFRFSGGIALVMIVVGNRDTDEF